VKRWEVLLPLSHGLQCRAHRIAAFRKKAPARRLDPNQWFRNIELLVSQTTWQVTVSNASNINNYSVGYKLPVAQENPFSKANEEDKEHGAMSKPVNHTSNVPKVSSSRRYFVSVE
jgi:hypothetical protein